MMANLEVDYLRDQLRQARQKIKELNEIIQQLKKQVNDETNAD